MGFLLKTLIIISMQQKMFFPNIMSLIHSVKCVSIRGDFAYIIKYSLIWGKNFINSFVISH